jgi:hypothetical protein
MPVSFKFSRVDNFLDDMNREDCFDTRDMDGLTPNYRFVLASECPQDIEECIDEDGTLRDDKVTLVDTVGAEDGFCSLLWGKGVNGERSISIADSTVSYDLGEDDVNVRGIFLINIADGTGYVLAYCILDKTLQFDGTLILPVDGLVWSMRYGN